MPETFEQRYRAAFCAIRPSEESLARLSEKLRAARPGTERPGPERKRAARLWARARRRPLRAAALALSLAAVAALIFYPPAQGISPLKAAKGAVRAGLSQAASSSSASPASSKAAAAAAGYAGLFGQLGKPQARTQAKGGAQAAQNFAAAQNAPSTGASSSKSLSTVAEQPPAATDPNLLAAGVARANFTARSGGVVYALAQRTDGTVVVTAVSAAGKQSRVLAEISCDAELAAYTGLFPAMGGVAVKSVPALTVGTKWADYRPVALYAENGRLAVVAEYGETYAPNGVSALVYDVSNPAAPKLLQSFAQCGSYTGSREAGGALYLLSSYTPASPKESDPESFVPQVFVNGARSLLPASSIAVREAGGGAYAVAQAVRLSGSTAQIYACAVLGGGDAVWAGPQSLLLARSAERTVSSTTTYGNWVQVPREKQTAKTGSRLRYQWVATLTTVDQSLSLYALQNSAPVFKASGELPGAFSAEESAVDEQNGRFILVTESFENQEAGGCYVNESGEQVDYAGGGIPEPPAYHGKPADTALYVLDAVSLARVGTLSNITSEWADSVRFAQNRCTLETQNGSCTVDFSNPAAPKLLR